MKVLITAALGVMILSTAGEVRAAPVTLKVATVMPRGGPWTNALSTLAAAVKRRTRGRVILKMYYGGVAGTERRAVARMRASQLHGVASGAVGLTSIDKTLRLFELPLLFRSYKEFRYVSKSMHPLYAKRLAKRGYRLLAIASMGFVNLYSKSPLRTLAELKGRKHWTWKYDPTAAAFFKALGVRGRKLPLSDVLPSLQAGTIDTVYGMPHATQSLQWHTSVSYVLKFPVTLSIACLVFRADALARVAEADRKILCEEAGKLQKRLNRAAHAINRKAQGAMIKAGIKALRPSARLKRSLQALRPKIWGLLRNVTYRPGDLKKVKALLAVCRSTSCGS